MWRSIQKFIQAHAWLRAPYTALRHGMKLVQALADRRTMSEEQLAESLREIGVVPGATIFVHCSIDEVTRRVPSMNAVKLITLLQTLLGKEGTLLVLTSPFSGLEADFVRANNTFDVKRTPSKTGLFTEIFRRMPGVMRSLQPTHPVAGWGKNARALLEKHHTGTAFGPASPFLKLRAYDGKVIGIGAPMGRFFTIMHAVEELHPRTHKLLFEEEPYRIKIVNGADTFPYTSHALKAGMKRNVVDLEDSLLRSGAVERIVRSGLVLDAADAGKLIDDALELIEKRVYIPE